MYICIYVYIKRTFYINFVLIFKGIRHIFTNLLIALNLKKLKEQGKF